MLSSERNVHAETEESRVVSRALTDRETEIKRHRRLAELRNQHSKSEAGGNSVIAEAGIVKNGAGVEKQYSRNILPVNGLFVFDPPEELPITADRILTGFAVVIPNSLW